MFAWKEEEDDEAQFRKIDKHKYGRALIAIEIRFAPVKCWLVLVLVHSNSWQWWVNKQA